MEKGREAAAFSKHYKDEERHGVIDWEAGSGEGKKGGFLMLTEGPLKKLGGTVTRTGG